MTLELRDGTAVVSGVLAVEEVEPLVAWLRERPDARVDLAGCTHLHTAGLQALRFFRPAVTARPADRFLTDHVLPYLLAGDDPATTPEPHAAEPTGANP